MVLKTHCKHGHDLRVSGRDTQGMCRECRRKHAKKWNSSRKGKATAKRYESSRKGRISRAKSEVASGSLERKVLDDADFFSHLNEEGDMSIRAIDEYLEPGRFED